MSSAPDEELAGPPCVFEEGSGLAREVLLDSLSRHLATDSVYSPDSEPTCGISPRRST